MQRASPREEPASPWRPDGDADADGALELRSMGEVGAELRVAVVEQVLPGHPQLGTCGHPPAGTKIQFRVGGHGGVRQRGYRPQHRVELDSIGEIERRAEAEELIR